MTSIGADTAKMNASQTTVPTAPKDKAPIEAAPSQTKAQQTKVTLSDEGKALLAALQQIEHDAKKSEAQDKTVSDKVESFTHGALGMDHPDNFKEETDASYSAGQYLSAAATIGGLVLLLA